MHTSKVSVTPIATAAGMIVVASQLGTRINPEVMQGARETCVVSVSRQSEHTIIQGTTVTRARHLRAEEGTGVSYS